ncbi:MAG: hypothetical protein JWP01_1153 [Myxococcales bacterium]|nr:hypothetical protein [Myxococcales bacterium]
MRALLTLLLLASAAPLAHAGNNELTMGSYVRALRSSSANAVTTESLTGGSLQVGRALHLGLMPDLEIWATAGLDWGGTEGTMFQTMTTEVDTLGLTVGGRARYALHANLAVSGRLDLGTARNELTLTGNGHMVSDSAWGGTLKAAAGLDLLAIAHPRFSLGLRVELGHVAATATALSPREAGDSTKIELDAMQASIGHLDLGGTYLSFSVMSQF